MRFSNWFSCVSFLLVAVVALLCCSPASAQEPRSRREELNQRAKQEVERREQMIREKVEQIKQMEADLAAGKAERDAQMQRLRTELKDLEKERKDLTDSFRSFKERQERRADAQRREEQEQEERRREWGEQEERERAHRELEMHRAEIEMHHMGMEQTTLQARIAMDEVASAAFALQQLERLVPGPEKQLDALKDLLAETDHPAIKRLLRMKIMAIAAEHDPDLAREQVKALILQRPEEGRGRGGH